MTPQGTLAPGFRALTLNRGRISLRWHPRTVISCAVLIVIALAVGFASLSQGKLELSPGELWTILIGQGDPAATSIVWEIRMPRVLTGLFTGACLAISGAVFQSLSRNALGSPDLIGFTSGAATGAVAAIMLAGAGVVAVGLASIAGGLVTAIAVYVLARKNGETDGQRLILVGIGVGALLQAVTVILLTRGHADIAIGAQMWLTGTLNLRGWDNVATVGIALVLLLPALILGARHLNALEFDERLARQLGVKTERVRLLTMGAGVALVGLATAATGPIGFVALAAPHLARRLVRVSHVPLAASACLGATLLLAADLLGQVLPISAKLPVGLMTGVLGGFYLLWLLLRKTP